MNATRRQSLKPHIIVQMGLLSPLLGATYGWMSAPMGVKIVWPLPMLFGALAGLVVFPPACAVFLAMKIASPIRKIWDTSVLASMLMLPLSCVVGNPVMTSVIAVVLLTIIAAASRGTLALRVTC